MLLQNFLKNSATKYPDKIAVIHQKDRLSYKELNDLSDVFAAILMDRGVKKGDRVAVFLNNSCEYLIAYFAILKSGAVITALNTRFVCRELGSIINDCSPKIIISDKKHEAVVEIALKSSENPLEILLIDDWNMRHAAGTLQPEACSPEDLAMIIYTSGTTADPKGVMLSHENLSANAESIIEYLHLTVNDKIMVVLPFYSSYGNSLITTHIRVGGTLVIDNRFTYPNLVLDSMLSEEVTGFAGVPSNFSLLIKKSAIRKYQFPNLRYVTQAGGAMAPSRIKEFLEIVPNIEFYVMYGQTEASPRLGYLRPEDLNDKMGSIGKAIPGVELTVLNEEGVPVKPGQTGEVVAKGRNIMQGYWNTPEETALVLRKEGLFTGDLAQIDEDGFISIVGSKKDIIKSMGNSISPFEIENVVCQIPNIVESAAVGIPDKISGEAIALFVVGNGSVIEEKDIMLFCRRNLAAYKVPKEIEIVSELPKTGSGKIKRQELRKKWESENSSLCAE